jgi:hypothetical protein
MEGRRLRIWCASGLGTGAKDSPYGAAQILLARAAHETAGYETKGSVEVPDLPTGYEPTDADPMDYGRRPKVETGRDGRGRIGRTLYGR